ncbi:MAG: hypothetical protein AAGJ86_01970 [Pseudomonadota bacterium]
MTSETKPQARKPSKSQMAICFSLLLAVSIGILAPAGTDSWIATYEKPLPPFVFPTLLGLGASVCLLLAIAIAPFFGWARWLFAISYLTIFAPILIAELNAGKNLASTIVDFVQPMLFGAVFVTLFVTNEN